MSQTIAAVNLKAENLTDPIGINITTPELSWVLAPESAPHEQSAWQIRAAARKSELENGPWLWNSGKIEGSSSVGHVWKGAVLGARTQVFWQLKLWDEAGKESEWSAPAMFETGLLTDADWDTCFVGFPGGWSGHAIHMMTSFTAPAEFERARLYVSGPGWSEAYVNGVRMGGKAVLQPAQTDFQKSLHYVTYDMTSALKKGGNNIVAFHLGSGWYGTPVFRYRMEVDGKSVNRSHIFSLPSNGKSSITKNSVYGGEEFDGRLGLDTSTEWIFGTEYDPTVFHSTSRVYPRGSFRVSGPVGAPRGFEEEPIVPVAELPVKSWKKIGENRYTADFGINFAGVCRLKVKAPEGTRVEMKFAEFLYEDGSANQENLLGDNAIDAYTTAGIGDYETYQPHFTYHGFRFVEVTGLPYAPEADTLTGVMLRTNCRPAGSFKCSNELVNQIFEMIRHTEESNIHAVPTDCPQRTERMGWLNDMMARCEGALYMFDESNLMTKWLRDIKEAQQPSGDVPMTAPYYWAFDVDPVCSSYLDAAWNIHKFYGKTQLLEELFDGQRRWVEYMVSCCDNDGILRRGSFVGDWVPPLKFNKGVDSPQNQNVPHELVATALMYYAATLLINSAKVLGRDTECAEIEKIASKIREDFRRTFHAGKGILKDESQSAYAYALYCGLLNEDEAPAAAARLADIFKANGCKHSTGNIGTKYLIESLAKYGYAELAWKLISSDDYPGWGFMIRNGATAMWERWEKAEGFGMNSHNHPMLGAPAAWFFRYLAGIQTTQETNGFDRFVLAPNFIRELDFAEANYDSRAGMVRAHWKRTNGKVVYDFEIPAGSRASVRMPDGSMKEYRAGKYSVEYPG